MSTTRLYDYAANIGRWRFGTVARDAFGRWCLYYMRDDGATCKRPLFSGGYLPPTGGDVLEAVKAIIGRPLSAVESGKLISRVRVDRG